MFYTFWRPSDPQRDNHRILALNMMFRIHYSCSTLDRQWRKVWRRHCDMLKQRSKFRWLIFTTCSTKRFFLNKYVGRTCTDDALTAPGRTVDTALLTLMKSWLIMCQVNAGVRKLASDRGCYYIPSKAKNLDALLRYMRNWLARRYIGWQVILYLILLNSSDITRVLIG